MPRKREAIFYVVQSEANNVSSCLATKERRRDLGDVYARLFARVVKKLPS